MPGIIALLIGLGTTLFNWLGSFAGSIVGKVTIEGAKFVAYRAFILFLLAVVFPVLVYNIVTYIIVSLLDVGIALSVDNTPGSLVALSLSFTGLAGWLAQNLYLPQCVSVYMSAVSVRYIMHLIPFL